MDRKVLGRSHTPLTYFAERLGEEWVQSELPQSLRSLPNYLRESCPEAKEDAGTIIFLIEWPLNWGCGQAQKSWKKGSVPRAP